MSPDTTQECPRLLIAGTGGDSGKTVVSLGLLSAAREDGDESRAFKKGPDFIDAAWLSWAAGSPARNLDTFLMRPDVVASSFQRHAIRTTRTTGTGLNLIEGNRGLLDGLDAGGTHSSAALARLVAAPVLLVVSPVKVTATAAAAVLGCRQLAPDVNIAGVILNKVSGSRHARVVRQAIEEYTDVPVLGAVPRVRQQMLLSRHLGLVPPAEHAPAQALRDKLAGLVRDNVELDRIRSIAAKAGPIPTIAATMAATAAAGATATADEETVSGNAAPGAPETAVDVKIGYFSDTAFTFYYPENLEALSRNGATLVPISALSDQVLPDIDALYIGGGFPETHIEQLAANGGLHAAIRREAKAGLPIHAECGGLMYLAERLETADKEVPLAGVLPIRATMHERPQGHGYAALTVDRPNPIFPVGTRLKGHEFHYSTVSAAPATAFAVEKGSGVGDRRDGIVQDNVLACYVHLHALGTPEWAPGMLRAARVFRESRGAGDTRNSDRLK